MLAFYVAMLDTEEQKDKFTEIHTTHHGMMYQVARASTRGDKLAEDALHETCLELIETIDYIRTDNTKRLAYYLRMATQNRAIDFMCAGVLHPYMTNSGTAAVKSRIHRARQLLLQDPQNDP